LSAALEYHRATNYPPGAWEDEEETAKRYVGNKPAVFKDYGEAERLPLEASVAGALLGTGAGVVRSRPGRDYQGGTMHWRAYSSAGGLFPVEAYVATPDGLYSFDALTPGLVAIRAGNARDAVASAVGGDADVFIVLTGIPGRTGWKYLERGYRHIWWDAGTMLANLLALAAADGLDPRLYTAFVDRALNDAVAADGVREFGLAVLALTGGGPAWGPGASRSVAETRDPRFPRAEAAHAAGELQDVDGVRAWRTQLEGDEPVLDRDALARAMRRRRSIRTYSDASLPRTELEKLLAWAEAPIPSDAPRVVSQLVSIAAVDGLEPGIYDAQLKLLSRRDEQELREQMWFVAMEQEHPRDAAANVFQLAHVEGVVERLGDRGYRWAQLEAGVRAGRVQIGAFMHEWGAAASTFYDDEVSRALETHRAPMLMVAVGARRRA
jgi:SagB-type dehydrogenase family enzyme